MVDLRRRGLVGSDDRSSTSCGAAIRVIWPVRASSSLRSADRRARHARRPSRSADDRHRQSTSSARRRARSSARCSIRDRASARPPSTFLVRSVRRMTHTITLIPGDGIGPEVTEAVVRILEAAGRLDRMGAHQRRRRRVRAHGQALPVELIDSIRRTKSRSRARSRRRSAKGSPASTSACARRWTSTRTCGRCGTCRQSSRGSRTSTSSSSARTPRTCTPASSTTSCPASSRA